MREAKRARRLSHKRKLVKSLHTQTNHQDRSIKHGVLLIILVILVGALGSISLTLSNAATPTASIEAENPQATSTATQVADQTAGSGKAVKFVAIPPSSGGATCPAYPAFPDGSCTGWQHTGVTLVKVPSEATSGTTWTWNGYAVVPKAAGVTITGLDISGGYEDTKGNVSLTSSYVRCTGITDWCVSTASGARLTDVEVGGGANGQTMSAATGVWTGGPNNVLTRLHIHHVADGLRVDGGTAIYDSYIHRLIMNEAPAPGAHSDGSQTTAGSTPIIFDHNTIEAGNNDALFFEVSSSAITVTHNFLKYISMNGMASSYGVGAYQGTSITVTNNVFSNEFKPAGIINRISPATISGNTYVDGTVVTPSQ